MSTCFYHPDVQASATCVQCGVPICAPCTNMAGVKTACANCFPALQARVATQPSANNPVPTPVYVAQPPTQEAATYKRGVDSSFVAQTAGGLGLGLVFGIISSIAVMKILFYAHFGISYLFIGIGYAVGFGIHKVTGRGGVVLGTLGVVVMLLSLLVGQFVYAGDLLHKVTASGDLPPGISVLDVFPTVLESLGFMYWACVVIGLGACFRAIVAQEQ